MGWCKRSVVVFGGVGTVLLALACGGTPEGGEPTDEAATDGEIGDPGEDGAAEDPSCCKRVNAMGNEIYALGEDDAACEAAGGTSHIGPECELVCCEVDADGGVMYEQEARGTCVSIPMTQMKIVEDDKCEGGDDAGSGDQPGKAKGGRGKGKGKR